VNGDAVIFAFYATAANLYDLGAVEGIFGLQEVFSGSQYGWHDRG
jgi:hypothetical protein